MGEYAEQELERLGGRAYGDEEEYTQKDALYGIRNFLRKRKLSDKQQSLLKCYALEHEWTETKDSDIAAKIQEDFSAFVKWLNKLYPKNK